MASDEDTFDALQVRIEQMKSTTAGGIALAAVEQALIEFYDAVQPALMALEAGAAQALVAYASGELQKRLGPA